MGRCAPSLNGKNQYVNMRIHSKINLNVSADPGIDKVIPKKVTERGNEDG